MINFKLKAEKLLVMLIRQHNIRKCIKAISTQNYDAKTGHFVSHQNERKFEVK